MSDRLLAALAVLALAGCAAPQGGPLVVVGATLIDGTGGPPLRDAFIVIEGDRIKAVGHQSQVPLPKGAQVFDARGKIVVPTPSDTRPSDRVARLAERVRTGMAPLQALAELSSGRIVAPGQPADLLILDRDPLVRPENLDSVFQRIASGRLDPR